jgi:plastocyanin
LPSIESLETRALLATVTVHIFNFDFSENPQGQPIVDPTIHVGDTVHWVWDQGFHSTTSVAGIAETWNSGNQTGPGPTFDHTFTHVGTFAYFCDIHGQDNGNGTAGGMSGTITVVANPTLTGIMVMPTNPTVAAGLTDQFMAMGEFSDGSTTDLSTQVTWASDNTPVVTISNAAGSQGLATGVSQGNANISATLGTISGSAPFTVTAPVIQSIAVTPANPRLTGGSTEQFHATGTFSDHSTQDLTSQATWASANNAVATISNLAGTQGLATAIGAGTSNITATFDGQVGGTLLTVTAPLVSITITPDTPSVPKGETEQFTAMGHFGDGTTSNITSDVTWGSSDTAIATISNIAASIGKAFTLATGTSTISASLGGITGSTVLTVNPATVVSITVTPANPSLPINGKSQFTATGTLSDHTTEDLTNMATWGSSVTSVASITATGMATGLAAGRSAIVASFQGVTGTTLLTVQAPLVRLVAVSLVTNKRHMVTQINVTFSGALNAAEAKLTSIYRLATAGKNGSFTAKNAKTIKLKSAVYKPSLNRVILTPNAPFALKKTVQLLINGTGPTGLQDASGQLIDGDHNGTAGGNAIALITKSGVHLA